MRYLDSSLNRYHLNQLLTSFETIKMTHKGSLQGRNGQIAQPISSSEYQALRHFWGCHAGAE